MITLGSGDSIQASTTSATTVNYIVTGALLNTAVPPVVQQYQTLSTSGSQVGISVGPLYTATGVSALVSSIFFYNTSPTVSQTVAIYRNGTTSAFQEAVLIIPVSGWAQYEDGTTFVVFNASGLPISSGVSQLTNTDGTLVISPITGNVVASRAALTGDVTSPLGSNATTLVGTTNVENIISANTTVAGALQKANNLSDVVTRGTSRFNLRIPDLASCQCVSTTNISIASPGTAIDGYTFITSGSDTVLLSGQTTTSQNGVWTWNGSASPLTRGSDTPSGGIFTTGRMVQVMNGTVNGGTLWYLPVPSAGLTIDTTAQPWTLIRATGIGGVTSLTGDVTGTGPGATATTLATVNASPGTSGSATNTSSITTNAKGLVTSNSSVPIQIAESQVTNLTTDLAGKQPTGNYVTALTGDVTATGPGSAAATLATVNTVTPGSYGTATSVPSITVNGKGLVTASAGTSIQITESQVTNLTTDLAGKQATGNYITALTGGVTASGPGSVGATVVTNANLTGPVTSVGNATTITSTITAAGPVGSTSATPVITYNAAGQLTTVTSATITPASIGAAPNPVPLADIATIASDTVLGNATGSTAVPTAMSVATTNALLFPQEIVDITQTVYNTTGTPIQLNNSSGGVATTNLAALNSIFANAPTGSKIWFPTGTCFVNGPLTAFTKDFAIEGVHGWSLLYWIGTGTSANLITLSTPGSGFGFYGSIRDMLFQTNASGPLHTGYVIDCRANVNTVIEGCIFTAAGATPFGNCITFSDVTNGGNGAVVSNCYFEGWTNVGILVAGLQASPDFSNLEFIGNASGLAGGVSQIGISCTNGGAILMVNVSIEKCFINLSLAAATGNTVASIFATNCFFDQGSAACLLITGTGSGVNYRSHFVGCWFTMISTASGTSCISIPAGSSSIMAAIEFQNCWIVNVNAAATTTIGLNILNCADLTISNSQISGWSGSGININAATGTVTSPNIVGNTIGPTNNGLIPANGTGIILNGTMNSVNIVGNQMTGNTTALTDTSTVSVPNGKTIQSNNGLVSRGAIATLPTATTAIAAASTTLVTGTSIQIPTNSLRVGSRFRFHLNMTKALVGAVTWSAEVKFGTANTSADGIICTFLSGTNTTVADSCSMVIDIVVTALGSGTSATVVGACTYSHTLNTAATGFGGMPGTSLVGGAGTATAFNSTLASPWLHLDILSGAAGVYTAIGWVEVVS